ncbi:MAG TPA: hypothetical protein VKE94_14350, partial [Gemmataceae bacterium]|nr:hypothetical protein [Gemmataceae bacterium]
MSHQPTPRVLEAITERHPETLTPDRIEAVLGEFRTWLEETAARGITAEPHATLAGTIDLQTLLAQFTALRHEVNLQTKAVRAQQEQNAQTLATLQQGLASGSNEKKAGDEAARAQIKTLIEIHDALALAAREAKRVRESLLPSLAAFAETTEDEKPGPAEPRKGI